MPLQSHALQANFRVRPDKKLVFKPNQENMFLHPDKRREQLARTIVLVREKVVHLREFVLLVNTGFHPQGNVPLVQQDVIVGHLFPPL